MAASRTPAPFRRFSLAPLTIAMMAFSGLSHAQSTAQPPCSPSEDPNCSTTSTPPPPPAADAAAASSSDTSDIAEIVVRGVKASVESAIGLKQNAQQITDSIVAEDIGKLPDNTVAAALARVSGVQITRSAGEASGVQIRGLPDVVTTLNGRNIFTTTGRSIALADIPADLLQRVDVYKTTGADNLQGGISGLIDVRLRRPFDFDEGTTVAGGVREVYSDQAEDWDPVGSLTLNHRWNSDWGEMGAMISASYQRGSYNQNNTFNGSYYKVTNPITGDSSDQVYEPTTIGAIYSLGQRTRQSANMALQWKPNDNTQMYFEGFFIHYDNPSQLNYWIPIPSLATTSNTTAMTLKPDSNVMQSLTATNMFTLTSNQAYQDSSDTGQLAIGGTWENDFVTVASDLAYTKTKAADRNFILDTSFNAPVLTMNFDKGGAADAAVTNADGTPFDVTDSSNYSLYQYYDNRNNQDADETAWKNDFTFHTTLGPLKEFKTGFRLAQHDAKNYGVVSGSQYNTTGQTVMVDDITGLASLTPNNLLKGDRSLSTTQWMVADRNFLMSHSDEIRTAMGHDAAPPALDPALYFDDTEDSYAGYVQSGYDTTIAGLPIDGLIGVRVESTDAKLRGTEIVDGVDSPVNLDKNDTEVLPSLTARLLLTDDLYLRGSAARSYTRPSFSALNPQLSLYQASNTVPANGSGGNPDLDPVTSDNYDLSLEWYFSKGSQLSAAVFYRSINGYIQTYADDEIIDDVSYSVSRPRNTGDGSLKGLELDYVQFFDFLPSFWSGFGVQLNATFIDASTADPDSGEQQRIVDVSDSSYNAVLLYEYESFSARLAYNWRSTYTDAYNVAGDQPGAVYVKPTDSLDLSMNYDINDNFTVLLEGTNLLKPTLRTYFGGDSSQDATLYPRDVNATERTISVGARFRF